MSFCKKEKTCIALNTAPSVNPDNVIQSLEGGQPACWGNAEAKAASLFVRHHPGQQGAAEAHDGQFSVGRAAHALPLLPREEAVEESTMSTACGTRKLLKTVYLHRSSEVLVHQL